MIILTLIPSKDLSNVLSVILQMAVKILSVLHEKWKRAMSDLQVTVELESALTNVVAQIISDDS